MDAIDREVYGHIVASDDFQEAFVIPFPETIRDIQEQLRAQYVGVATEKQIWETKQALNAKLVEEKTTKSEEAVGQPPLEKLGDKASAIQSQSYTSQTTSVANQNFKATRGSLIETPDLNPEPLSSPLVVGPFHRFTSTGEYGHSFRSTYDHGSGEYGYSSFRPTYDQRFSTNRSSDFTSTFSGPYPTGHDNYSYLPLTNPSTSESSFPGSSRSQSLSLTPSIGGTSSGTSSARHSASSCFGSQYICGKAECKFEFSRLTDLKRHIRIVHNPESQRMDCPYGWCGRVGEHGFTRRDHMNEHISEVHKGNTPKAGRRNAG